MPYCSTPPYGVDRLIISDKAEPLFILRNLFRHRLRSVLTVVGGQDDDGETDSDHSGALHFGRLSPDLGERSRKIL